MISVVVPVFNEGETLEKLHAKILGEMISYGEPFEIIFIDDGSSDNSFEVMETLRPLKRILLQRNYGQTPALDVGIQAARGEIIIVLDADLQNDPAEITSLLRKLGEGYDVVVGWRKKRYDPLGRRIFSSLANYLTRKVLGVNIHDFGCGLKAFRSSFIKEFRLWGDMQIFLVAVAKEKGAHIGEIEVTHGRREFGYPKVKISRMVKTIFDLLAVKFMLKYFTKPVRFFGGWGVFFILISTAAFGWSIYLKLEHLKDFSVTPLPVIGTLFMILGVLLFMMGFLAEVLLRIYYEAKNYSPYFVREIKENK